MRDGLSQGCKIAHSIHFFHVVRINLNISDLQWHKFVARSSMCVAGTVVPLQISGEKLEWRMCYHENAFRASTTRQAGNSHHYHIVPAAARGYSSLAPEQAPVLIRFFNNSLSLQSFVKQELWQSKKTKHHFDRNVQFIQSFCGGSRHFSCNDVKSFVRSPRSLCSMWAMSALIVFLFHWNLKSITTKLNGKNSESWRFTMKNDELFFLCLYFSWVLDESLLFTGSILRSGTVENSKSSPLQYICMADRFTLHTNM